MPEWIELLSILDHGVITVASARAMGVGARDIQQATTAGRLVRIRRGAYVARGIWDATDWGGRHRLLVIAAQLLSPRPLVVSHLSAAAMHGLPTIGRWPETVHVLAPGAAGGASARLLTAHTGAEAEWTVVDGIRVTTIERTLVDVAAAEAPTRSVTVLDAALRAHPLLTVDRLLTELDRLGLRYHAARAERAIRFADGRSESPGESLSRVRIHELGFEAPDLQMRFEGANRGRDAIVDFYWRGRRTAGEFDGKHKYTRGRFVADDRELGDVVFEEKRREDALRRTVIDSMARWVWADAMDPHAFFELLRECDVPRARSVA